MKISVLENGPFMVNTFLLVNPEDNRALIIDPGSGVGPILDYIKENKLKLEAIIATHGHIDHLDGVNIVKGAYAVPLYASAADRELISSVPFQARMFGVPDPGEIVPDLELPLEGEIEIAGIRFSLLHTPGHSPGSVSLFAGDAVFCGDALFNFSIGRTDLPGGDYEQLIRAIEQKLFTLPDSTVAYPGHGPSTTIGTEKEMNPFFR